MKSAQVNSKLLPAAGRSKGKGNNKEIEKQKNFKDHI